jgi:PAS domain-containing protein
LKSPALVVGSEPPVFPPVSAVGCFGERRKRAEEELDKAREELERRAEERTAELSRTNELLEQKIAERKQAEGALHESRELLHAVIDTAPVGINAKDQESRYVLMKRCQAEIYGLTPHQVGGKSPSALVGREYGDYIRALKPRGGLPAWVGDKSPEEALKATGGSLAQLYKDLGYTK